MNRVRQDVLRRYEKDQDGTILIDVAAARLEDLFNDFDKTSPFNRRDLDQDLVDYLIDCAAEIGRAPFRIRFLLGTPPRDGGLSRLQQSIESFFLYMVQIERRKLRQVVRQSWLLFGIGLSLLFISFTVHQRLDPTNSVVAEVFAEGLTIAAWVSMWNAVAIYLIDWFPHHKQILLFRRLCRAETVFSDQPAPPEPAATSPQPPVATGRVEARDSGPYVQPE